MAAVGMQVRGGTTAQSGNLGSLRSPIIWANFPWSAIFEQNLGQGGDFLWENWLGLSYPAVGSNLTQLHGSSSSGWQAWVGTGATITGLTVDEPTGPSGQSVSFGTIRLTTGTNAAHTSVGFQLGKESGSFGLSSTSGSMPKQFFEARVRFNTAGGTGTADYFLGMATPGLMTGNNTIFSTADALVTSSQYFIGFTSVNSATINPMYAANAAQTNVTNGTGAGSIPSTLTNWTKLGFFYDPTFQGGNGPLLQYFQDGALLGYSQLKPSSNWPSAQPLTPTFVVQLGGTSTTSVLFDIDWIAVGQSLDSDPR